MTDHADLIARLEPVVAGLTLSQRHYAARSVRDAISALGDTVPREQMTVDRFREAVGVERASHEARGYDTGHDRAHGVPHLLSWAIDYASRGEAVKSGALIVAALSLSGDLEREERAIRAERDALAAREAQVRSVVDDVSRWRGYGAQRPQLVAILDASPAVSLARHDAEVKAQALDEAADELHQPAAVDALRLRAAAIRAEAATLDTGGRDVTP